MVKSIIERNLLDRVEQTASIILKRRQDLQIILDECLKNNLEEDFEELVFTGKYIEGLKRVLKKGGDFQEIENLDYVKKDLGENMEKVIEQVRGILLNASVDTKSRFEESYLTLSAAAFQNLNELIADLEQVKKYLNYQKRKK
jgi:hypothetical protein